MEENKNSAKNKQIHSFVFSSFLTEFKKTVSDFPDRIAISSEFEKITYSELNERVLYVSRNLQDYRIQKGDVIALWMEKSIGYIEYILAIWHLGAVFLPVDSKTPKARVDWICIDADVKLLITDNLIRNFDSTRNYNSSEQKIYSFVKLKGDSSFEISSHKGIDTTIQSNDNAYIIYTSGSTGKPKGVVLAHEGIVNFIKTQIEIFQISSNSRLLQYLSIGFDASLSEIGIALLSGAEIRIEKEENLKSIEKLIEIFETERITHICLPPSLIPVLPIERIPSSLETIIIGGEVCPVSTVRDWSRKFRLVNVYGPTEATVCSSLVVCESNWNKPLIGNPIPNRKFHILDENLVPVKDGEPGELYLSGIGLAREYLNQIQMTNEKFIFKDGIRMYKTGDRVLRHSPEEVEFLGRMDRQFKLRGNLIEPSEVERVLTSHPNISFAYVMKRKLNREILIAYIIYKNTYSLKKHRSEDISEIKQFLSLYLSRWMVPERFVILEKIPLNSNGKLEVKALPEPESTRPKYLSLYKEPNSEREEKLCQIFEKILSIQPIGVADDFFLLGGDSISMVSLLAQCSLIGITLSAEAFIQSPTVEGIVKMGNQENSYSLTIDFLTQEAEFSRELKEKMQDIPLVGSKFSNILLTGANGFLGSRILFELVQAFDAEIYCIVRNLRTRDPKKQLEEIFFKQRIIIKDWSHIHFLEGDISKPRLGLSEFNWDFLTSKIDTVFHFAATVNLVLPYNDLKAANIDSTREVLKFCMTKTRKYLHYASTLSVFVSSDDPRNRFYEAEKLDTMQVVYGGYAQSKWVSEKILLNAIENGMDSIHIYRFGLITGDSQTGYSKTDDFFSEFLKSIFRVRVLPELEANEIQVDITPIDYAAKACIAVASTQKHRTSSSIFHIANSRSLSLSNLVAILKNLGEDISQVTKQEFEEICRSNDLNDSYLYLSLSRFVLEDNAFTFVRPLDLFQATGVRFDFANTDRVLEGSSITCPCPDEALIEKYIEFLELKLK